MAGIDGGRITVTKYREKLSVARLIDVLHVSTFGNVQITTQCLRTGEHGDASRFVFLGPPGQLPVAVR